MTSAIKTLRIDGMDVSARPDETILEVARQNGIFIPTLCHVDGLSGAHACRLCLVEVKGLKRLVPACTTECSEHMEVVTRSERLDRYRRALLELMFSERNHVCSACLSSGCCELQDLAARLGMTHVHFPLLHPPLALDASHERFLADPGRCILCTRCVRVCAEVEGAHTLGVMARSVDCRIVTDLHDPWARAETCTGCGKCVHVCPTGALSEKGKPRRPFSSGFTVRQR